MADTIFGRIVAGEIPANVPAKDQASGETGARAAD